VRKQAISTKLPSNMIPSIKKVKYQNIPGSVYPQTTAVEKTGPDIP
jgi:hypothetical protein